MDANRFDVVVRRFGATTRRGGLRLLVGGALGGLPALLGRGEAAACRLVGKPCTRSGQCCAGARCKGGRCRCKSTHYKCGTICCLLGANCNSLPEDPVCTNGAKQGGDPCDPVLPGQCASGTCGCRLYSPPNLCSCREADCAAIRGLCEVRQDCCQGECLSASAACGGGERCCRPLGVGEACKGDCDCCGAPDSLLCRRGRCCIPEFAECPGGGCCGDLVCSNGECLKP